MHGQYDVIHAVTFSLTHLPVSLALIHVLSLLLLVASSHTTQLCR